MIRRILVAAAAALALASPAVAQNIPQTSIAPVASPAAAASFTVAKQGRWLDAYVWRVTAGASAGYVMVFDAAAKPADGVVAPLDCVPVAANASVIGPTSVIPAERYLTALTLVFSTTGCFTKTESATAYFRVVAQ